MTIQNARPQILTAVPVGFSEDGSVDLKASRAIVDFVAQSGVDGALILGTTGEFPALSEEERYELARISLDGLRGLTVVVHVGAPSVFQVKRLITGARELGAESIAVLTPYYMKSSDEAILAFYKDVTSVSDGLRVYLYLFAQRTGNAVSPALLTKLAQLPNVVGAKVSGESLETIDAYRAAVPASFEFFTGGDRDISQVGAHGVRGVVSGIASVFPKPFLAVAEALERGDVDAAAVAQPAVDDVVDVVLGDPERMKVGLGLQGVAAGTSRMALDAADGRVIAELRRAVADYA